MKLIAIFKQTILSSSHRLNHIASSQNLRLKYLQNKQLLNPFNLYIYLYILLFFRYFNSKSNQSHRQYPQLIHNCNWKKINNKITVKNNQFMQDTKEWAKVNPSRLFYYRNRTKSNNEQNRREKKYLIVILFLDIVQCTVSVSLLLKFSLFCTNTKHWIKIVSSVGFKEHKICSFFT